jgi:hypothetical protein
MEPEYIERSRIQKLSGPNYRNWALQIQIELIDRKVWSAIDAKFTLEYELDKPEKEETKEVAAVRKEQLALFRDNRARRIILENCIQSIVNRVIGLPTAKEIWEKLKSMHARDGLQQLDSKNEAFGSYLPPATTSVFDVATMLNQLQDDIGAIEPKDRPSDSRKTSRLLTIMRDRGGKYDIASAQIRAAKITDYQDIIDQFVDIEEQIKATKPVAESARQASTDTGNMRGKGGRRGNGSKFSQKDTRTCYHCGKSGHIRRDCNAKKRGEPKTAGPSTGPLAAPGGGKGLSPPPPEEASAASIAVAPPTDTSWIAAADDLCGVDTRWVSDIQAQSKAWIMDSGCSRHMTYAKEAFVNYIVLDKPIPVRLANGMEIQAVAEGTVSFEIAIKGGRRRIELHEVLHVPKLAGSLISVSHLQDRGIMTRTTSGSKMFLELKGQVIGVANRVGRSYVLDGT